MSDINVSIIIPNYNYSIYIPTCLNSILNHSLDNIEVILLINKSNNNFKKLLGLYTNNHDNIKIIFDESGGNRIDLNLGIKESSGKYVAFLDSNDYIEQNMFEKLFNLSEDNALDISMCKIRSLDDVSNDYDNYLYDYSLSMFNNLKKEVFSNIDVLYFITEIFSKSFNKLFNKSFLINNNITFSNFLFEDDVFFFDTFLKASRISIVDEYLYVHRFNNRFTMNMKVCNYVGIFNAFKLIRDKFIEVNLWQSNKTIIYNHFIKLFFYYFNETSEEYKESFFNEFKFNIQTLLIKDNVLADLKTNYIIPINNLISSDNYSAYINNSKKVFSVVIPCYGAENNISNAVNSVINQTLDFKNFIEIILIDIGSDDSTLNICKNFVEKYPNNVNLLSCGDLNEYGVKNFALNHISGIYVNFLEADDTLYDDTLSKAYNYFGEHHNEIS